MVAPLLPYLKVWIHHWVVFVRTPPAPPLMSGRGWSHTQTQNYKNFTLSQLIRLGVNKTLSANLFLKITVMIRFNAGELNLLMVPQGTALIREGVLISYFVFHQ